MSNRNKNKEVRVEDLLRLKKLEKPSTDFWNSFDSDFERKRLNALVEKQSFSHRLSQLLVRASYVMAPVAVVFAFGAMYLNTESSFEQNGASKPKMTHLNLGNVLDAEISQMESPSTLEEVTVGKSLFVVDEIRDSWDDSSYDRVLYNSSLQVENEDSSARYVNNSIPNNEGFKLTTASLKSVYSF